jgi:hypothetical protein
VTILAATGGPCPVGIVEFKLAGPVRAVRRCRRIDHDWQVCFDGNRGLRESLAAAGLPAPIRAQLIVTTQR